MVARWLALSFFLSLPAVLSMALDEAAAQPMEDPGATTELSCSFAMAKGPTGQTCQVPFPQGCLVSYIPGTKQPWTTISRGGRLVCRFDNKGTDWKTKITGACSRCQSDHCSAKFSVRFDCSHQQ